MRKVNPATATWYDYKMAVVGSLLDNHMFLVVKEKSIELHGRVSNGGKLGTQQFAIYKKMPWIIFYTDILPKLVNKKELESNEIN